MKFSKRLSLFNDEIFAVLDRKKQSLIEQGRTVYNFSIGTPDFEAPQSVRDALCTAAQNSQNWRYSLKDSDELLDAVCSYYKRRFNVEILPEQIMSVNGSQEGIGHIGLALCNDGDTVLLPDPGYPVFTAGSLIGGAVPFYYPLLEKNKFLPDLDSIPEDVATKTKYMIVSFPSNPLGSVANPQFYEKLVSFAEKYDILIIHDNAYSDIIFDGNIGRSFFNTKGADKVGVEFFSLSKSFDVTGARISFLVGRKDVIDALKLIRSQYDFGMFTPIQKAAVAALNTDFMFVKEQCRQYQIRRDALCSGLRSIGWNVPDSHGSMFVWAKIPKSFSSSMQFCEQLMEKTGVICTPGSSFGKNGEGYVRFALTLPPHKISEAVASIKSSKILD